MYNRGMGAYDKYTDVELIGLLNFSFSKQPEKLPTKGGFIDVFGFDLSATPREEWKPKLVARANEVFGKHK